MVVHCGVSSSELLPVRGRVPATRASSRGIRSRDLVLLEEEEEGRTWPPREGIPSLPSICLTSECSSLFCIHQHEVYDSSLVSILVG